MRGHCKGFTLIELLMTIAVLTVLLTLAVPSFNSVIQSNRVTTGANSLVATINLARSEAVRRAESVRVCPWNSDAEDPECQGTDWSQELMVLPQTAANGEVVRVLPALSDRLQVSLTAGGTGVAESHLDFLPLGNVAGGGAFVYEWVLRPVNCRSGRPHQRRVAISVTGRPQVVVENCP